MISFKLWNVIICVILVSFADCDDWEEIHSFDLARETITKKLKMKEKSKK